MEMLLIGSMIVAWFLKQAFVDGAHAVRGQDSPRLKRRLAELEAAKHNGGFVPRTGMSGYIADLWADAWEGASARRAAKRAHPNLRRTPWFEGPGAVRFFARRWNDAWDRLDRKFASPTRSHRGSTADTAVEPQPEDITAKTDDIEPDRYVPPGVPPSWIEKPLTPPQPPAPTEQDDSWLERVVDGEYTDTPTPSTQQDPAPASDDTASSRSPEQPSRPLDPYGFGEAPERGEEGIGLDLLERFHAPQGPDRRWWTGWSGPPIPDEFQDAAHRIRIHLDSVGDRSVDEDALLADLATRGITSENGRATLAWLTEIGYIGHRAVATPDPSDVDDSNVIPIRSDIPTTSKEKRNMFVPQTDGTKRQAAKAIAEQLVGEMAGQLGSLDLLAASLKTEGVQGDIFAVLAGYRDRFAVMEGAANELNMLIDAHGVVTDAYMNSNTQAPRDFVAPRS